MHTEAMRRGVGARGGMVALPGGGGNWGRMGAPSMSTLTSTSSSLVSSLPANECELYILDGDMINDFTPDLTLMVFVMIEQWCFISVELNCP